MTISQSRIEELAQKYHWFKIGEDGVPELYFDNHMMQTFRACEAHFVEDFIYQRGRGVPVWSLQLGSAIHKMMEIYYMERKNSNFSPSNWAVQDGAKIWHIYEMDYFSDTKEYALLGGQIGFTAMLLTYVSFFAKENDRFRVIGTELYFGSKKEVPLLDTEGYPDYPFRLYLCGKIDLLVDDGESICPMDHKSSANFRGKNPSLPYELQEGMTGYVFAARAIVNSLKEKGLDFKRIPTNKIWMNYLQIAATEDLNARYKRAKLYKTDAQLEEYRLRQIRTASNIFELLMTMPSGALPAYNTMMCQNWYHRECSYFSAHRLENSASMTILDRTTQTVIWNPEEKMDEDKKIEELYGSDKNSNSK